MKSGMNDGGGTTDQVLLRGFSESSKFTQKKVEFFKDLFQSTLLPHGESSLGTFF